MIERDKTTAEGLTDDRAITVLLPVKEYHPRFLQEAIESVLAQTSPEWQLLVLLDPAAAELADQSILTEPLKDFRVGVTLSEGRKLAGALNTGMRVSQTEFVAILLGDDLWDPEAVEVLTANIQRHPDVDFFYSARRYIYDDGRPISGIFEPTDKVRAHDFLLGSPVKHLLCWRRLKALSFGGMDETLNNVGPDDYDFPWSMLDHGAKFRAVPQCLYYLRDHRTSYRLTTHQTRRHHLRELRRILEKHGAEPADIALNLKRAKRSYLRQCLYRNELDRWWKDRTGFDPERAPRRRY